MGDKLKTGIAVVPVFVEGEQPLAPKLNSLGAQLRRATQELEQATGDLRGQSWPYTPTSETTLSLAQGRRRTANSALSGASERHLDIANIARLIGPASNLNPRSLPGATWITEPVPIGVHEFELRVVPSGTINGTNPAFTDTGVFASFKATKSDLAAAGDYHVSDKGVVYCATVSAGGTVTYAHNPVLQFGGMSYQGATFNVIPDPNQIGLGSGLAISAKDGNGRYPITLPTITHQQSDITGTTVALDDEDPNYLQQLYLPAVLTSNLTAGEEIPAGFVYLKNYTTNELLDDAVFYYDTNSTLLAGNIEIDNALSAGDDFILITVGTDITSSIDDLRIKQNHTHDRTFGEPLVNIVGLGGILAQASNTGPFVPSEIPGNFAPQYLHRDGWRSGVDANFNDQNIMRGDLGFGLVTDTPGSNYNVTGETYGINFGSDTTRNRIYRDADNDIVFESGSTGGRGFRFTPGAPGGVKSAVAVFENGIRGEVGDYTNSIKMWAHTGAFNTNIQNDINLSGFDASHQIYNISMLIDFTTTNNWVGPNNSVATINYEISVADNIAVPYVRYTPNVSVVAGSRSYRLIVWYR